MTPNSPRLGATLLSLLFLSLAAPGCGDTQAGSNVATHPSPGAAHPSRAVTHRSHPTATARCQASHLRIFDAGSGGVAAGTEVEAVAFRSDQDCYLQGHPSVWLLSKPGHQIAVVAADPGFTGKVVLSKGKPVYADLFYENPTINSKLCPLRAHYMGIRIPAVTHRILVKFHIQPMRFCPHEIRVTGYKGSGPIQF